MKVDYDDRQEADWVDRHGISAARLNAARVSVCVGKVILYCDPHMARLSI